MSAPRLSGALIAPVTDRPSAEAWLTALVEAGLDFHLDDVGDEAIVNVATGQPIFHPADMPLVRAQVAACYRQDWGDSCPIGFILDRLNEGLGPRAEAAR